jgi:hypothetical protein
MSLLPNTKTTHNSYAACGRHTSFTTQHRNTRHNDISLLWPERENREFILEFSGLYHYQLREGRKPYCPYFTGCPHFAWKAFILAFVFRQCRHSKEQQQFTFWQVYWTSVFTVSQCCVNCNDALLAFMLSFEQPMLCTVYMNMWNDECMLCTLKMGLCLLCVTGLVRYKGEPSKLTCWKRREWCTRATRRTTFMFSIRYQHQAKLPVPLQLCMRTASRSLGFLRPACECTMQSSVLLSFCFCLTFWWKCGVNACF